MPALCTSALGRNDVELQAADQLDMLIEYLSVQLFRARPQILETRAALHLPDEDCFRGVGDGAEGKAAAAARFAATYVWEKELTLVGTHREGEGVEPKSSFKNGGCVLQHCSCDTRSFCRFRF